MSPMSELPTLPSSYFDDVYAAHADPWGFETSAYEKAKYAKTLAALPPRVFESGFEIGCSIGVLTALLARRCHALLSVDVSEAALEQARKRLATLKQVRLQKMNVPHEFPDHKLDLVVMSEVGYFWSFNDLALASARIVDAMLPQGVLVLVHWTPLVAGYPLTGDAVHEHFLGLCTPGGPMRQTGADRELSYRLDVLERTAQPAS